MGEAIQHNHRLGVLETPRQFILVNGRGALFPE